MEIKTKFNIGDTVVRVQNRYDGVLISKCEVVGIVLDYVGNVGYRIRNNDDTESVKETDIYHICDIKEVLKYVKDKIGGDLDG